MEHNLEPCFLVAAPSLSCPFFHHTVVLLVDHRHDGSLGFVVNKPAEVPFDELIERVGVESNGTSVESPVMLGGPVATETGWLVFDPSRGRHPSEGVLHLGDRLGVCANLEMLKGIARGDGPESFLMMLGYAGWGPGQLDDEIQQGSWIVVDLDPDLVFATKTEDRWESALAQLGIDPAQVAGSRVADA